MQTLLKLPGSTGPRYVDISNLNVGAMSRVFAVTCLRSLSVISAIVLAFLLTLTLNDPTPPGGNYQPIALLTALLAACLCVALCTTFYRFRAPEHARMAYCDCIDAIMGHQRVHMRPSGTSTPLQGLPPAGSQDAASREANEAPAEGSVSAPLLAKASSGKDANVPV